MPLEIKHGVLSPADFVNVRSGFVFWVSLNEVLLIVFMGSRPPGDSAHARTHDYFERERESTAEAERGRNYYGVGCFKGMITPMKSLKDE